MTEFQKLITIKNLFEIECDKYEAMMKDIVGDQALSNGLTPDHIKFSDEYQYASKMFAQNFKGLRVVNGMLMKNHKKEYRAYSIEQRDAKRAAKKAA